MTERTTLASVCCGLLAVLCLIGFVASGAEAPAEVLDHTGEAISILSDPLTRIAVMTSDLDEEYVGRAMVEGEPGEITIRAGSEFPREIRGQEVLVYHSGLFGGWRLFSTDIGLLTPVLRDRDRQSANPPGGSIPAAPTGKSPRIAFAD